MKTSSVWLAALSLLAGGAGTEAAVPPDSQRAAFVGYYPSWLNSPERALDKVSRTFSQVFLAFAFPDPGAFGPKSGGFAGMGLDFAESLPTIRAQIAALQQDGIRVILSVGGAEDALAERGHGQGWKKLIADGRYRKRLALLANRLGVDGIDLDYEVRGNNNAAVKRYAKIISIFRTLTDHLEAANAAGRINPKQLVVTVPATAADCISQTAADPDCREPRRTSAWAGAGIVRRVLKEKGVANQIDMLNLMTYDIGFRAYDPKLAYAQMRTLLPASVPVNLGLEVLASATIEGYQDSETSQLMLNDADTDAGRCDGTVMLNDQYSMIWEEPRLLRPVNRPYSVETFAHLVREANAAEGRHDGLMLWSLFRIESENLDPAQYTCLGKPAATPETARIRAAEIMGWPIDDLNVD